jgi:hypothetical protein
MEIDDLTSGALIILAFGFCVFLYGEYISRFGRRKSEKTIGSAGDSV